MVHAARVVPSEVNGDHRGVVLDLLTVAVRKSGERAHRHAHGEVRTFHVGRADVIRVRVAARALGFAADAE